MNQKNVPSGAENVYLQLQRAGEGRALCGGTDTMLFAQFIVRTMPKFAAYCPVVARATCKMSLHGVCPL